MIAKPRLIALVSLLAFTAGTALAADTKSPANTANSAKSSRLERDSNGAAAVPLVLKPAAPESAPVDGRPALTADQKALNDVMQRGQAEVAALAQSAQAMPRGPARDAIEHKILDTKLRYRVEFLHTLSAQQRGRGELAAAQATDAIVDQLVNPKRVPAHTEAQSPDRRGAVK